MRKDLAYALVESKICITVLGCGISVYDHKVFAPVRADQRRGRINREGCAAYDQQVGAGNQAAGACPGVFRQHFAIERHIRTDLAAAAAVRNRFGTGKDRV